MVDGFDGRCERPGEAIELDRARHRRDRTCRRRSTVARGTLGQQLGVAFVQPDEGVSPEPLEDRVALRRRERIGIGLVLASLGPHERRQVVSRAIHGVARRLTEPVRIGNTLRYSRPETKG